MRSTRVSIQLARKKIQISQWYQMIHYQREDELMSHPTSQKQMVRYHIFKHQRGFLHFWVFLHMPHTHTYTFLICANESRRWKKLTVLSFFTWRWQQCAQGHLSLPLRAERHLRFNLSKAVCLSSLNVKLLYIILSVFLWWACIFLFKLYCYILFVLCYFILCNIMKHKYRNAKKKKKGEKKIDV